MASIKRLLALLVLYVATVSSEKPAVRVLVTQKGLNYVMRKTVEDARQQLLAFSIPDTKGQYLGVKYHLKNVKITHMNVSSTGLMPSPNKGLFAAVKNVYLNLSGEFEWWSKDRFEVDLRKMSIIVVTNLEKHGNRLVVPNVTCASKLEDVKLKIDGDKNFWFSLFSPIVKQLLKTKIPSVACYEAKKRIKALINEKFSEFPIKQTLEDSVVLDYSVVKNPSFKKNVVELFLKGEFQPISKAVSPWVHEPRPLPFNSKRSRMMYVTIMDHTANSACQAFFRQGVLNVEVSAEKNLPKRKTLFGINIGAVISPIQVLKVRCPKCDLRIKMEATSAPRIKTTHSGVHVNVSGLATFKLVSSTNSTTKVLVLGMNISATATPKLNGTNLATQITNLRIFTRVLEPKVGLPTTIQHEAVGILQKEINHVLQKTLSTFKMPLPMSDRFKPVNSKISYGKHHITLETDVESQ